MRRILVTGANGFVGSNVCKELLKDEENIVYAIARSKGTKSAFDRVIKEISRELCEKKNESWKERIVVLDGNIQESRLGLDKYDYENLCNTVSSIYHCAASIKFSLSYDEAKKINCGGTNRVLEFLRDIKNDEFDRLNYVSTAYIAGSHTDGFKEKHLNINQKFANTYERTKFECEILLNKYINDGWPITIFRPSIVSSNSITGATHENNIIHKFIKLFKREKIKLFYCNDDSSINIVPVDYFVSAMLDLSTRGDSTIGKTFNLVNHTNVSVKKIVSEACGILGVKKPQFTDIDSDIVKNTFNNSLNYFFHYVNMSHKFDDNWTRGQLEGKNIKCVEITEKYLYKNIQYCQKNKII